MFKSNEKDKKIRWWDLFFVAGLILSLVAIFNNELKKLVDALEIFQTILGMLFLFSLLWIIIRIAGLIKKPVQLQRQKIGSRIKAQLEKNTWFVVIVAILFWPGIYLVLYGIRKVFGLSGRWFSFGLIVGSCIGYLIGKGRRE